MPKNISINTPTEPMLHEHASFVGVQSYDPNVSPLVNQLFAAFIAKYHGDNLMAAFFEWLLAQLPSQHPYPYIHVSPEPLKKRHHRSACGHASECMHFESEV